MFDFKSKLNNQEIKIDDDLESVDNQNDLVDKDFQKDEKLNSLETISQKNDLKDVRIHTMPDKFLASDSKNFKSDKSKGKKITGTKRNILMGAVVGVIVILLLALSAFLLLKSIENPQNKNNKEQEKINVNQNNLLPPKNFDNEKINKNETTKVNEKIRKCSKTNCELCSQEECLNFKYYCHLEDKCLYNNNFATSTCPQLICVNGKKILEDKEYKEIENKNDLRNEQIPSAPDLDSDLLSEIEENLWNCNPQNKDTDGDGYLDGEEILNSYDPTSTNGGKLLDSGLIKKFVNQKYGYSIIYPTKWEINKNNLKDQIIFKSTTGEFIQVIVENNYAGYTSAKNWYLSQNQEISRNSLKEILIGNWSGIMTSDGLNVYLLNSNYIYTIAMNIGLKDELNYNTTFKMMLNNFKLFENPIE